MRSFSLRRGAALAMVGCVFAVLGAERQVLADVYRWDNGQVIGGTEGIVPGPGVDLSGWNTLDHQLIFGNFIGMDLSGGSFNGSWLDNAKFKNATLTGVDFSGANLTGAKFKGARIEGQAGDLTQFNYAVGFTARQLKSTASYKDHNLHYVDFTGLDVGSWNFSQQQLDGSSFSEADVTHAKFNDSTITGLNLYGATGFTKKQLYSTTSYQNHDLHGVIFGGTDMTKWNLDGQNLTGVMFQGVNLLGATFAGATISEGYFDYVNLSAAQLYSTVNYQAGDLSHIDFLEMSMAGFDFTNQNLSNTLFFECDLSGATFAGANLKNAMFYFGTSLRDTTAHGLTAAQLYSTVSYKQRLLAEDDLGMNDLSGWNFSGQNLTNCGFAGSNLAGTTFFGATIRGVDFSNTVALGLTASQLYATASYKADDLKMLRIRGNRLDGWNFANQCLFRSDFSGSNLTNADFTGADLREATGWVPDETTIVRNTIRPNAVIKGLDLRAGERLILNTTFDLQAVTITEGAKTEAGSTVDFVLMYLPENTTKLRFAAGVVPEFEGTLKLTVAPSGYPAIVDKTYDLFDWNGELPMQDRFSQIAADPRYQWDLSKLYVDGTVTIVGAATAPRVIGGLTVVFVPEPASVAILAVGAALLMSRRSKGRRWVQVRATAESFRR